MTLADSTAFPARHPIRWVSATVPVTLYGSRWSVPSLRLRLYLARAGVPTDYVAVDRRSGRSFARTMPVPSVSVDGDWLHRPDIGELRNALARHGFIERQS